MRVLYIAVDELPKNCHECLFFHLLPSDKKKGYCDAGPGFSVTMWTSDAKKRRLNYHCPLQKETRYV